MIFPSVQEISEGESLQTIFNTNGKMRFRASGYVLLSELIIYLSDDKVSHCGFKGMGRKNILMC
jgi:hypothetical protein